MIALESIYAERHATRAAAMTAKALHGLTLDEVANRILSIIGDGDERIELAATDR
jgi:hypothetical protein